MRSTMIGDSSRFGIEFAIDGAYLSLPEAARWLWGRIRFWCDGYAIGDWQETASLSTVVAQSKNVIAELGRRRDRALCAMDAESAARLISEALYQDTGQSEALVVGDSRRYSPFVVTPATEVFDGWRIILMECESVARLIWYPLQELEVRECHLRLGEYEDVLRRFVAYLTLQSV